MRMENGGADGESDRCNESEPDHFLSLLLSSVLLVVSMNGLHFLDDSADKQNHRL